MTDHAPDRNGQTLQIIVVVTVVGTLMPPALYAIAQQTEYASENNLYIAAGCSIFLGVCAIVALWKLLTKQYPR